MKRALAIIVGVAAVCVVAYLSWLNPGAVEFHFSPTRSIQAPLSTLMIFASVVGVVVVLLVVMIQAGRRAVVSWRHERQQRRVERVNVWEERGEQLVWEGDTQQGRTLLQRARRKRPESPRALLALAASYRDTGELQRARLLLTEAEREHRTNPDVLLMLAELHQAAGDAPAAVEVLERLRALQPRAPRVLRALRDRYVHAKRWADAATLQEALLAELRDPNQTGPEREYLTALRLQAGLSLADPHARVQALEALADRRSVSVPVSIRLGDALLADGREDEASAVWERGLRGAPRTVFVERLASIATEPRHRDRLRALLQKLRPDQVRADNVRLLTAELYLADGNVDAAASELEGIREQANTPSLLHALWGDVHRRRGQLEQAVSAYAHAHDARHVYECTACQRASNQWTGFCPTCRRWDSYRSTIEIAAT